MDDHVEELRNAGIGVELGTKVFVSMMPGIRSYTRLPNGEMERTIEESHLIPSSPYETSNIYILPKPTAEYGSCPCDTEVARLNFRHLMLQIDGRHGIQSVQAFAAHRNGAERLTPQLLPAGLITMKEDDFTLWCTLTLSDGTSSKILKVSP